MTGRPTLDWVVLTMGDRPTELAAAVASIRAARPDDGIVVVVNSDRALDEVPPHPVRTEVIGENLGVPGGRDRGVALTTSDLIGFLDDDAELSSDGADGITAEFESDDRLGAVSLRLVDEVGETARRHVPRHGERGEATSGDVALFLGGASVIRRTAYDDAGGYFTELHYGHEELELSWRLVDRDWTIRYLAQITVFHPRTEVSRHASGWRLTGRNRVWIARRTLPWPVAIVHVGVWALLGLRRAPAGCRRSYARGWVSGWSGRIARDPIRWRTVIELVRRGRPPFY